MLKKLYFAVLVVLFVVVIGFFGSFMYSIHKDKIPTFEGSYRDFKIHMTVGESTGNSSQQKGKENNLP